MFKIGIVLSLTLIALGFFATNVPETALKNVSAWIARESGEPTVSQSDKVLTRISRVDARVQESDPMRISLEVQGEHPDGCDFPVIVDQSRSGAVVDIEVYRNVPADVVCPMILKPYRDTIHLAGSFDAGEYTINVNAHSQTVQV